MSQHEDPIRSDADTPGAPGPRGQRHRRPETEEESGKTKGSLKNRFAAFLRRRNDPLRRRRKKLPAVSDFPEGQVPLWVSDPEHYCKKQSRGRRFWKGFGTVVLHMILICGIIGVVVLGVAAAVVYSFSDTELDERFASMDLDYSSFIYATNSTTGESYIYQEIESTSGTRVWVSDSEIPQHAKDATVAIEDKRFYKHIGVDPIRTTKAVADWVIGKFVRGSTKGVAGGSTLTQQVIKNMTGDTDQTPIRKIKEMLQALYIERRYTKDQILEYYLNTVYFGSGANGIAAAASEYFGKDASELTVVEAAAIVAITKSPTYYDPSLHPENNKTRRNDILYYMKEQGYITEQEFDEYVATELVLNQKTGETEEEESSVYDYYTDMVIQDALEDLKTLYPEAEARNKLYHGGLRIYSCVDPDIQNLMQAYFADDATYVYRNSAKDVIVNEKGETEVPQVAMMVMNPKTGDILGVIGGRGAKNESRSLNRATKTPRQPGSSIKPLSIYGYAIEHDILKLGDPLDDSPVLTYKNRTQAPWPSNYDGTYSGLVSVKKALSYSLNAPAARGLQMIGLQNSYNFMVNTLHFTTLTEEDGTLLSPLSVGALGNGVTLREMVTAYTVFAGGGMYSASRSYSKIVSYDGKTLIDKEIQREAVFSEQTAFLITDVLGAAVTVGSSAAANLKPIATAGKSGTTSYFKDRWFIGYTPDFLGGIWWGYDTPNSLENTEHVRMWHDVMAKIHALKGITESSFTMPDGIVSCSVCWKSGELPGPYCSSDPRGSSVQTFYYKAGTQPTKTCSVHHQLYVCPASGKIAHSGCPTAYLKTFVDIQRSFNCTVWVNDAGTICPRLSPNDILYVSDTLPVYAYMIPEGEFPSLASNKGNTICTVHAPGANPHAWQPVVTPPVTDTSTEKPTDTTDTNTDVPTTDTSSDTDSVTTDVSSIPTVTDTETTDQP